MPRSATRSIPAYIALSFCWAVPAEAEPSLRLLTEDYAPMNYIEGEKIVGASTEQVELLMERAQIEYSLEMMPWARGYALTLNRQDLCLFSTAHTEERDPKFKWVEPLVVSKSVLIARKASDIHPKTIEEAWKYTVGTQRSDVTYDILTKAGFPKIDIAANFDMTLKKLLAGRIDLMMASDGYFREQRAKGAEIKIAYTVSEEINSIACGKKVPDTLIEKMQASLDSLIVDGTQGEILEKYGLANE